MGRSARDRDRRLWRDERRAGAERAPKDHGRHHGVSEAVYLQTRRHFAFAARGPIDIKGRGRMATYWLLGRAGKAQASRSAMKSRKAVMREDSAVLR